MLLVVRAGREQQRPIGLDNFLLDEPRASQRGEDSDKRGCSSAGRAPDLHSGGRRFDPDQLHQFGNRLCIRWVRPKAQLERIRTADKGEAW